MRRLTLAALIALLSALLWTTGDEARADAPPQSQIRALEPWLALPQRPAPEAMVVETALRYNAYDTAGEAATPGSYAFLADTDGATSAVVTYEDLRNGTTAQLLIHKTDAQGTSQAALYNAVEAGDLFEWRQSYDCWVRYRVTEVRPNPPGGAAPRKLLAVEWTTYAFTGCTGAIAPDAAVALDWGPLPDLGGPSLTAPIVHGPYQLVPEGWRDPALPAVWTFRWATAGDVSAPTYGYWAMFATERGGHSVTIFGYYADYRGHPEDASWRNARGAYKTRTIAGRPARIAYSPPGPSHDDFFPVTVWIYDPSTEAEYVVLGKVKSLRGSNVDALVAIARGLFEGPDAP